MRGLLTSIITAIAITSLQAQPNSAKPKLVVGITIDQLSTELIEAYWDLYSSDGFKKLWKEGLVYKNTDYSLHRLDRASAISTINTGTQPSMHGIVSNNWLDQSTLQPESCIFDKDYMGNYTSLYSSPSKLLCSTITDELNRETIGGAQVYSIAPYADMAILMAGHSANGVLWFDTENGKWASSTYYREYPQWVGSYNEQHSVVYREEDLVWTPQLPIEKYHTTNKLLKAPFRHKLTAPFGNRYHRVTESPIINSEILKITEELFNKTSIGEDQITDYLQIGLYAGNTIIPNSLGSIENQDTYVRIDQNIAKLLKLIDQKVGLHNTLLYLTSTGYRKEVDEDSQYNIPQGEFHLNRSTALLNLYLMAKYGEGQFIKSYDNLQIYLSHDLIEKKKLDLAAIQKEAALFLLQISGVQDVFYSTDFTLGSLTAEKQRVKNSYFKGRTGDLVLKLQAGWKSINSNNKTEQIVSYAAIQAPTIFLGGGFEAQVINTPIKAEAIAPTIAKTIRIRAPNAAKESPIR